MQLAVTSTAKYYKKVVPSFSDVVVLRDPDPFEDLALGREGPHRRVRDRQRRGSHARDWKENHWHH